MGGRTQGRERDRWTAAELAAVAAAWAVAVVVLVAGFRWWTSLDVWIQLLAGLAGCAFVAAKIAAGLLAALLDLIRHP